MRLLIHIVTDRRLELLQRAVTSVLAALPTEATLSIVVNGEHEATVAWLQTRSHPRLHWISVPKEPRTIARNRAFTFSNIDVIHFLDDDVIVPEHLFRETLDCFRQECEVAVVGGPNLTPEDSPWKERVFGAIMTSAFATPLVRNRYLVGEGPIFPATERDLILCNLAVRRAAIPDDLRFERYLRSNEENLFLYHCRRRGLLALSSPSLYVHHYRRKTVASLAQQIYSYGYGRAQQTLREGRSCHPAFLVPAATLVLAIALVFTGQLEALFSLTAVYLIGSLVAGLSSPTLRSLGPAACALSVPLSALVHVSYGWGFWRGLVESPVAHAGELRPSYSRILLAFLLPSRYSRPKI